MNGYQVNHEWLKYAEEQRKRMSPDLQAKVDASAERTNAAADWVRRALPAFVDGGYPEPHAVLAACEVKRLADGGQVGKADVLAWLEQHAQTMRSRGFFNDGWLTDRLAAVEASR